MWAKYIAFGLTALTLAGGAGCSKSSPPEEKQAQPQKPAAAPQSFAPSKPIARVYWLGKKQIAFQTNAAQLMTIWNLPESQRLEAQTIGRLALAPWRVFAATTNMDEVLSTNPPAMLLRPVVEDLVQEEWFLEIHQLTNQARELVLAVHLDDAHAKSWEANLAAVLQALGAIRHEQAPPSTPDTRHSSPSAWQMQFTNQSPGGTIELKRAGGWTVIGVAHGPTDGTSTNPPSSDSGATSPSPHVGGYANGGYGNGTLAAMVERLEREHFPFAGKADASGPGSPWLDAEIQLAAFSRELGLSAVNAEMLPALSVIVRGDGQNVNTFGQLDFKQPLPIRLDEWQIPTNLVHDPLIGFSAVRGISAWLRHCKLWNELDLGTAPDQAFFWAQANAPFLHFLAVPSPDASNQVVKLAQFVTNKINAILVTNQPKFGSFDLTDGASLVWHGIPWFDPNLDYQESDGRAYIVGGLWPNRLTNKPAPAELWQQLHATTNLVWYDWEITQPCVEGLSQMTQMGRNVFGVARLTYTAGLEWLKAIEPKLGPSSTALKLVSPARLTFSRSSSVGFTGAELEVLADWLESPTFPHGLHTFVAPRPPPPGRRAGTNAPPAGTNTPPEGTNSNR